MRAKAVLLLLALWAMPLPAGEKPDMELIEFLGEFTGADGEWVDPMDLYLLDDQALDSVEGSESEPEESDDEQVNR